jgi:hypothetical protein
MTTNCPSPFNMEYLVLWLKPIQVRTTLMLTPRHVNQRSRICMHSHRYNPKKYSPKVSFFSDTEEETNTPKEYAMFIPRLSMFTPRENPRELFVLME